MILRGKHSDEDLLDIARGFASRSKSTKPKRSYTKTAEVKEERKPINNAVPMSWDDLD